MIPLARRPGRTRRPPIAYPTLAAAASLRVRYEADQGVTLVSGLVSLWDDLSGNGRHLTQATAELRPRPLGGDGLRPTIQFDGAQRLVATVTDLDPPFTVVVVARPRKTPTTASAAIRNALLEWAGGGAVGAGIVLYQEGSGSAPFQFGYRDNTSHKVKSLNGVPAGGMPDARTFTISAVTFSTYSDSRAHVWVARCRTTPSPVLSLRVADRAAGADLAWSGTPNANNSTVLSVGDLNLTSGYKLRGGICAILVFAADLSAGDEALLFEYLQRKFNP